MFGPPLTQNEALIVISILIGFACIVVLALHQLNGLRKEMQALDDDIDDMTGETDGSRQSETGGD